VYQKMLVPLDGSELAECVLPHVESIAKGGSVQKVIFLRVVEPLPVSVYRREGGYMYDFDPEAWKRMEAESRAAAENYLNELMNRVKYNGINVQSEVLRGGQVADIIADYATNEEVDLVVIATHGRSGVSRWIWGSVADRILRSSCVPVLMIRAPGCIPGI
jgi:nucleotide-binding universal stress UspA family protein